MASESGTLSFSMASVVEDVLQQHDVHSRDLDLDSRRAEEAVSTKTCRNYHLFRRRNVCLTSNSDTLVAGKSPEIVSKKEDEATDLKSWMHDNGLPPCKVLLKDKPCYLNVKPIHYVAASEDLQAGDIAFSVPNELVARLFPKIQEMVEEENNLVFVLIDEVESLAAARKAAMSGSERGWIGLLRSEKLLTSEVI